MPFAVPAESLETMGRCPGLYQVDPLQDERWDAFVERHSKTSIFHTQGWLRALHLTYGYEPFVVTTTPPEEELTNGFPFCRVNSWLTGRRIVSLPFSDHCQPLVENPTDLTQLVSSLEDCLEREDCSYLEVQFSVQDAFGEQMLRNLRTRPTPLQNCQTETSYLHTLDLRPQLSELFVNFHKSCIQRRIRHAERAGLTYDEGRSDSLIEKFYDLLVQTRRRHKLPPQPIRWFRNLVDYLGDKLKIRVASKNGQPVASIVTLSHKGSVVYKYGCSDPRFYHLGASVWLLWKAIQEAKELGAREFDMGRSELNATGLVTFKDRWGAQRSTMIRCRFGSHFFEAQPLQWRRRVAEFAFSWLPDRMLVASGRALYKHMG